MNFDVLQCICYFNYHFKLKSDMARGSTGKNSIENLMNARNLKLVVI